jgi:hypothetical protein
LGAAQVSGGGALPAGGAALQVEEFQRQGRLRGVRPKLALLGHIVVVAVEMC